MTRRILRYVDWHTGLDTEPDAEPVTHAMQCAVCGKQSAGFEDVEKAREWMLRHLGRHPAHLTYREHVRRPWRAYMLSPRAQ